MTKTFDEKGAALAGHVSRLAGLALMAGAGCSEAVPPKPELSFWLAGQRVESIREGDAFVTRFEGGPAGARVTVRSRFRGYQGWATYQADDRGAIDLGRAAALEGTYSGVDPDGLIWSMRPETPDAPGPLDVELVAEVDGAALARATLIRRPMEHGLVQRALAEDGLIGRLFAPAGGVPAPAVLVLGGSEGGLELSSRRAAHLAARGFTALGIAYFGIDPLPATLGEIPLEYFERALAWLARQPEVQPGRLAVLGISRGSEMALQLGATLPAIQAVVADVPSHLRWNGFAQMPGAAWTHRGEPLPYLGFGSSPPPAEPVMPPPPEPLPDGTLGFRPAWGFEQTFLLAAPEVVAAATIPIERIEGPILLIGAGDDGVWPSCLFVDAAMARLRATGHADRHADEAACHPDAGHLIGPPGAPTTDIYATKIEGLGALIYGGKPAAHAKAQREGEDRLLRFLRSALR
jgi:hypothetical protein